MQLIHITNREQFNVAMRTLEAKGYKPFEIKPEYRGECYIENRPDFLLFRPVHLPHLYNIEIIEFEDFIKEAI